MNQPEVANYKVISLLGEGGMGNVYLAEHLSIQRKVAIKVLKPELLKDESIKFRFKHEASILAQLNHPHIVGLIDYQETSENLFLIMEYVKGRGLDDMLRNLQAPMELNRAKELMLKILSAFSFAHANGIIHRDVKPSNILITESDNVKVLDFGIAKMIGDNQLSFTRTGMQMGTVYYMSPEQVKAETIDQRSDVYSLGITFYELLAGFCPYRSLTSEYEIFSKIVQEPLIPLTQSLGQAYEHVWNVLKKATEKDPNNRIQTCQEFIQLLQNDNITVTEEPKKPVYTAPKPASNSSVGKVVLFSIIGAIVFAGLGVFLFLKFTASSPANDTPAPASSFQTETSTDNSDNSSSTVETEDKPEIDYYEQIYGFFEAERDRDLDRIFSYYAPSVDRYYSFTNPSYDKIRKEYEASWRKTSFAANEDPSIQQINASAFTVDVTYRFIMRSSGDERAVSSRLQFVFDSEGKIKEVYSNN